MDRTGEGIVVVEIDHRNLSLLVQHEELVLSFTLRPPPQADLQCRLGLGNLKLAEFSLVGVVEELLPHCEEASLGGSHSHEMDPRIFKRSRFFFELFLLGFFEFENSHYSRLLLELFPQHVEESTALPRRDLEAD